MMRRKIPDQDVDISNPIHNELGYFVCEVFDCVAKI